MCEIRAESSTKRSPNAEHNQRSIDAGRRHRHLSKASGSGVFFGGPRLFICLGLFLCNFETSLEPKSVQACGERPFAGLSLHVR